MLTKVLGWSDEGTIWLNWYRNDVVINNHLEKLLLRL